MDNFFQALMHENRDYSCKVFIVVHWQTSTSAVKLVFGNKCSKAPQNVKGLANTGSVDSSDHRYLLS